jgi:hypothetical protein
LRLRAAEIGFRHDGEQRDLVHDGVQPRPAHRDVDLAGLFAEPGLHVFLVELEQAEKSTKSDFMKRRPRR